jgi:hypothetical protein
MTRHKTRSGFEFVVLPDDDTLASSEERRFIEIEKRIRTAEHDGLIARWECGKQLFIRRKGKQLPRNLIQQLEKLIEVSQAELRYRMKFYEKFPTKEQVSDAIRDFPSWYRMTHEGLYKKRKKSAKTKNSKISLRGVKGTIKQVIALGDIHLLEEIQHLLDEAYKQINTKQERRAS